MIFIRSPYNYDLAQASDDAAIPPGQHGVSMTLQAHSEDADINVLMRRFGVTGQLPQTLNLPDDADYSEVGDYQSALNQLIDAQRQFNSLPPNLRSRYNNDPQAFLEAVASGEALPALREAGLIPTTTPTQPTAPSAS